MPKSSRLQNNVSKTTVYGTLLISIQIEKNTIQIKFQNSLPKQKLLTY